MDASSFLNRRCLFELPARRFPGPAWTPPSLTLKQLESNVGWPPIRRRLVSGGHRRTIVAGVSSRELPTLRRPALSREVDRRGRCYDTRNCCSDTRPHVPPALPATDLPRCTAAGSAGVRRPETDLFTRTRWCDGTGGSAACAAPAGSARSDSSSSCVRGATDGCDFPSGSMGDPFVRPFVRLRKQP
jgi:hypothetical protein